MFQAGKMSGKVAETHRHTLRRGLASTTEQLQTCRTDLYESFWIENAFSYCVVDKLKTEIL